MVKKYPAPLSIILRWGHNTTPRWVFGDYINNPTPEYALTYIEVPPDMQAYIYGFYLLSNEANDFKITWRSGGVAQEYLITHSARGVTYFTDTIPLNEGLPADPNSAITVSITNNGTGKYRVGILIGFVEVVC